MGLKFNLPDVVKNLPWDEITELYDALVHAGEHPGQAAKQIAQVIDDRIDWREVVKGPVGVVLEAVDFEVIRTAIRLGLVLPRKVKAAKTEE